MYEIVHRFEGRTSEDIFERIQSDLWGRRREITTSDLIDKILSGVKWDRNRLRAGGSKRVMLVKSSVDLQVRGDQVTLQLKIPFKNFESKYGERMKKIFETLFDS